MFDSHVFTYADWAGDILTRMSTTGYAVFAADHCGHLEYAEYQFLQVAGGDCVDLGGVGRVGTSAKQTHAFLSG